MFKEQYERCAVLKDLQNSHVWKEQFVACQKQILEEGGSLAAASRIAYETCSTYSPALNPS